MSRFRRPFQDNLADVMFDIVTTGLGTNSPEAIKARMEVEAMRIEARNLRRLQKEAAGRRRLVAVGAGLLAGGLGTTFGLATVACVGLGLLVGGLIFYLAGQAGRVEVFFAGLLAWFGRLFRPEPRPHEIMPPEVVSADLPKSRKDLVQGVLDEVAADLKKLQAVSRSLKDIDKDSAALCERLVTAGERLSDAVAEQPAKFDTAQRVLTYHLPRAAYVAETFLDKTSGAVRSENRVHEARQTLTRMEMLIDKTLLDLQSVDEAEMNLEMRLINQALDEELGVRKT